MAVLPPDVPPTMRVVLEPYGDEELAEIQRRAEAGLEDEDDDADQGAG